MYMIAVSAIAFSIGNITVRWYGILIVLGMVAGVWLAERIAAKQGTEIRKTYDPNLYLYENEKEILKQVAATGIHCIMQTTPEMVAQDLGKMLG